MRYNVIPIVGEHDYKALKLLTELSKMLQSGAMPSPDIMAEMTEWMQDGGQKTMEGFKVLDDEMKEGVLEYLADMSLYEEIEANGKKYLLAFDLNVMEAIQAEYKTIESWSKLTNGDTTGEGDAKAILFGFTEMLNEGIEIMNEQNGTDEKPLTKKQVGRILTQYGMENTAAKLAETITRSSKDEEKNV
jgi:hypothetical protein